MLPRVSLPNTGVQFRDFDGIKRARMENPSSATALSAVAAPQSGRMMGVGDYASAGRFSDISTPWTFRAIPFNSFPRWAEELFEDSIIFIARMYPKVIPTQDDANRVSMFMLPQLHFCIHMATLKNPSLWTPEYVLSQYFPAGPMFSHQVPKGTGLHDIARGIVSKGDVRVVNYWGPHVHGRHHVFFVIKKVPINAGTKYITDAKGMVIQQPGVRADNGTILTQVTRFVPVISERRTDVDFADKLYMDEHCCARVGIPVYVGRVIENPHFNPAAKKVQAIDTMPTTDMGWQVRADKISVYARMAQD